MKSKSYCINLDRRPDRWKKVQSEFEFYAIKDVERFPAIDSNTINLYRNISRGEIACLLSHFELLKAAKWFDLDYVTIYEDDVEFNPDYNTLFDLNDVPADWDMIYLGGNDIKPVIEINKHVSKLTCTLTTHAYLVRNTIFDRLINLVSPAEKQIDLYYADLHSQINAYGFRPKLAWQAQGYSDIQNNSMDYSNLLK